MGRSFPANAVFVPRPVVCGRKSFRFGRTYRPAGIFPPIGSVIGVHHLFKRGGILGICAGGDFDIHFLILIFSRLFVRPVIEGPDRRTTAEPRHDFHRHFDQSRSKVLPRQQTCPRPLVIRIVGQIAVSLQNGNAVIGKPDVFAFDAVVVIAPARIADIKLRLGKSALPEIESVQKIIFRLRNALPVRDVDDARFVGYRRGRIRTRRRRVRSRIRRASRSAAAVCRKAKHARQRQYKPLFHDCSFTALRHCFAFILSARPRPYFP